MCLARAYVRPAEHPSACVPDLPLEMNGTYLVMENVTRVDIDGDGLTLRSLFGDIQSLHAHISSVDFSDGKLILECVEALKPVEA